MTIKKILTEPDLFLRQKSIKVEKVNDELRSLMDDMIETMHAAPGIGLAAIQVGVPKRVIVIDLSREDEKKNPLYFVNPEIISNSSIDAVYEEGCLSVPGQFAEINRPDKCKVKFLDYNGKEKILDAEGLLATCIQHEIDHLEGILFIDYLSKLKKTMIVKKLSKQKKSLERIVV
jgi:peptide deformylase|tara:strand:+ start:308 stop:832 length:525 start_codon:yes stop_codon:yes gene_type:complete